MAPDAASGEVTHPASTCRSLCSLSELYLGISNYSHWIYICCLQTLKSLVIAETSPCFSGLRSAPLPQQRELRDLTVFLTSCTLRLQLCPGDLLISVDPQKLSGDWRMGGAQSWLQWVKMKKKYCYSDVQAFHSLVGCWAVQVFSVNPGRCFLLLETVWVNQQFVSAQVVLFSPELQTRGHESCKAKQEPMFCLRSKVAALVYGSCFISVS